MNGGTGWIPEVSFREIRQGCESLLMIERWGTEKTHADVFRELDLRLVEAQVAMGVPPSSHCRPQYRARCPRPLCKPLSRLRGSAARCEQLLIALELCDRVPVKLRELGV